MRDKIVNNWPRMRRVDHIHFVGIGGVGMCGIAEVLHNEGYYVSGSDLNDSQASQYLSNLGLKVMLGHAAANIDGADVIVRSTAVAEDNVEIVAARAQSIPVIPRAAMLAELMRFSYGIAIAGTHGKTTTTSLTSSLLAAGGLDPSFVIGGKLNSCGTNAQLGKSSYFVAEADESDSSFLFLKPMIAVITNIDADHMEAYANDFNKLRSTFVEFLHHLPFYGLAVLCADDPGVQSIISQVQRPAVTYGFAEDANYRAVNWTQNGMLSEFTVHRPNKYPSLVIQFSCPGRHNVLNALAAVAIATELGVDDKLIQSGLFKFEGVGRRFQILGERNFANGTATIVDDYGHHPQEICATTDALHRVWPNKKLVHVFQPHRYSRTQALFDQFVNVLSHSDALLLLDIYSAGEATIPDISSAKLLEHISRLQPQARLVTPQDLTAVLDELVTNNSVVLIQGAGNIGKIARDLMEPVRAAAV